MQLQYNKKLIPPSTPISAESVDGACSGRLFITDKKSKIQFLVDTGAEISVYPSKNRKNPQKLSLYAANGTEIKTFGSINLSLDLGLRRSFSWSFILADVSRPIIGADFLRQFHLLPDLNTRKLVDGQTLLAVSGSLCKEGSIGIKMVSGDTSFHQLLREYPEIIMHNENFSSEHGIYHHIVTHGPPVSCRSRRLDPEKLKAAKEEFQYMLNKGIIQPSRSNWANPLHMVKKPNGEWRPCGDYRALNTITVPDKYPVPYLTDFQMHLNGVRIFSKLDLMKAFYQIPVHPHDIPKTAVITPFGLFEFLRMPFGLCNAAQTFQRFIDEVCRGLHFVFVYIDDVCVFSKSEEEHLEHLKILFERFKKYGIFINPSKCVFGQTEIDFLGHHVTPDGIKPLTEKVDVIKSFPLPKTIKELRRFLAMLNFYRKFLPHGAQLQSVLNDLLKGQTKKNDTREIDWSDELKQAFIKCRESLSNASFLTHPIPNASLVLKVDASNHAIGAVLEQYVDGSWQPLGFFSKKLTPTQMKYSTYDRELLAIFKSVQHFRYLLEARKFIVLTDHKPLTFAFKQKLEKASPRQRNHLDFIAQFSTDIRYIPGSQNVTADALSRIEAIKIRPLDYEKLSKVQDEDPELKEIIRENDNIISVNIPNTDIRIWCDVSKGVSRPILPKEFGKQVFHNLHSLSHPGIRATRKLITKKFYWTSMNKDINEWTRSCLECQRCKVNKHTKSEFGKFPPTTSRFAVVHMDIVGPLPPSEDYVYLLTCLDRFSRWPEAIPLKDIKTETVFNAFYNNWICRYGLPNAITTDRGSQFTSHMFKEITSKLGIKHNFTTSFHPQSNGLVERFHRVLKTGLTCAENIQWTKTLNTVLLGIRSVTKEDIGACPAEILYGEPIQLPGDFFKLDSNVDPTSQLYNIKTAIRNMLSTEPKHHNKPVIFINKNLESCSHVWIRQDGNKRPLQPKYKGPYLILDRRKKVFTLLIDGKHQNISIDRLKPAFILNHEPDSTPAAEVPTHNPEVRRTRYGRVIIIPERI